MPGVVGALQILAVVLSSTFAKLLPGLFNPFDWSHVMNAVAIVKQAHLPAPDSSQARLTPDNRAVRLPHTNQAPNPLAFINDFISPTFNNIHYGSVRELPTNCLSWWSPGLSGRVKGEVAEHLSSIGLVAKYFFCVPPFFLPRPCFTLRTHIPFCH